MSPFRPNSSWSRFNLEGFLLRVKGGEVTVITSNGHILAMCRETHRKAAEHNKQLSDHDFNLHLNAAAVPFVCRYWREGIMLEVDTVADTASIDGAVFTAARHEQDYPNIDDVVPKELRGEKPTLFSVEYIAKIAQCLKTLNLGVAIKCDFGTNNEPIVITHDKEPAVRFVVMPIRP